MMSVLLDPAHGGRNIGHVSPTGMLEKQVTLAIVKALETKLEDDFELSLTRVTDIDQSHSDRIRLAHGADVVLSFHAHAVANPYIHEVETWASSSAAEALARFLGHSLQRETGDFHRYRMTANRLGRADGQVVFIMAGHLSNLAVEAAFSSGERIEAVARAVDDAIRLHFGTRHGRAT